MTDDQQELFDKYAKGILSDSEKQDFLNALKKDPALKKTWDQYRLSSEVLKADEESSLRAMFREIDKSGDSDSMPKTYNKWWILASFIATLIIILGVSMVQFKKLEPTQVADQFRLSSEQRIQRNSDATPTDSLLLSSYYKPLELANNYIDNRQYQEAREALDQITIDADVIQENKEWMLALVSYMENGRSDAYFQSVLSKILDDATHNNYPQAVKLNDKVNNFWGRLRG